MIKFICECGSNWLTDNGKDFEKAITMIETAKEIGCFGVKFQYFKAEQVYAPQHIKQIAELKPRELPLEWIPRLSEKAGELGLEFGLSVFECDSVPVVNEYVDYFKIASYEMGYLELIRDCYKTCKDLYLSLGLTDFHELRDTVINLPRETPRGDSQIHMLHCVTKYPAKIEDCNLKLIDGIKINGWSDHTGEPAVIFAAVGRGAKIIEFHLELDIDFDDWKEGVETKYGHCWMPGSIEEVIEISQEMETALGTGNWDQIATQQSERKWRCESVHGLRGIKEEADDISKAGC